MKKYIDKTVIEKILHKLWKEDKGYGYVDTARISYNEALQKVQCEIDALEEKEMDFVKEFYTFSEKHKLMDKGIEFTDIEKTASFFFQLGMHASNPITAVDRGIAEEIIISLKQVENDYHIDQTKEIEWVRNKVKKERDTIETKEIDLDKTIDK